MAAAAPALRTSLPPGLWRADQIDDHGIPVVASGHPALDAQLPGGGWPLHALTELLLARAGIGELRLLAPALGKLASAERSIVLLAPPHLPYGPALQTLGLPLDRLLVVHADQPADRLWAAEQTLKSASFGALIAWLPQARPEQLRRLQLAAQSANGLVFLMRPLPAQHESSPAPLRLVCSAARVEHDHAITRAFSVRILKRRGPVLDAPLLLDLPQPLAAARTVRAAPPPVPTHAPAGACADAAAPPHLPTLARHGAPRPRVIPVLADVLDRARISASAA